LGTGAGGQKTRMMGRATGPRKKFDDIFSGVDTIHQRDRQTRETNGRTDEQTPSDSNDRAYM